jgi:predicted component of type VI protein secretion system
MVPLVQTVTAYSLSSHTTAFERPNARVLQKLGASFRLGYAAISLSISRRTSIRFPTRFISKIYGTPAALTCLSSSISPIYSPTNPIPHHVTEMVATAVGGCQLNTSRRILAEIQLRINGFNTYG